MMSSSSSQQCYPLHGLLPIINTPFDSDLNIDLPSVERLVERAISDGVAGCIVPAVASEVGKLTMDERCLLIDEVVRISKQRIKVVAGASSEDFAETEAIAKHAVAAGCDGVLCNVPERLRGQNEEIHHYFQNLATVGMDMLMIQDLDWHGYGMNIDLICRMFEEITAFKCLKVEVAPAGVKYTEVLSRTGGSLHVSGGWAMPQMVEALDRGVHAFSTTAINKPFYHIYRLHHAEKRDGAIQLFNQIVPYLAWSHQHIDISIQFLKQYCMRRGVFTTSRCREPILAYDEHHKRCADQLIDEIIGIEDNLPPC